MNTVLREDIQRLLDKFEWKDQTFRRVLVRACWAHIEAVIFGMKQMTLRACNLGSADLTANERAFLTETTFVASATGEVAVTVNRIDTLKNLKRTLKLASRFFQVDWKPSFNTTNWRLVYNSLHLRHRLTHPKSTEDLAVEDEEIEDHRNAFLWFAGGFNDFLLSLQARHGHAGAQPSADLEP